MGRIYAGFMLTVFLALALGTVSLFVLWWSLEQKDRIISVYGERLAAVKDVTLESERAARKTRAWLATGDSRPLADRLVVRSRLDERTAMLEARLPEGPSRELLAKYRQADGVLRAAVERLVELGLSGAPREEVLSVFREQVQPARDEVDLRLLELRRTIEDELSDKRRTSDQAERHAFFILIASVLASVLALGALLLAIRRSGRQIERQQEALREHTAIQERVMGVVGHDLRSPLTAALSSLEMFEREPVTPAQARRLDRVQRSVRRIQRLAQLLLDFGRTRTTSGLMLVPALCNVHLLCRTVVEDFRAMNPESQVTLRRIGPSYGVLDELRMSEVIRTLLEKASTLLVGGTPLVVTSEVTEEALQIRIEAEGNSTTPQVVERAFDPLWAGEGDEVVTLSSGLALHLARRIVEGHGGSIGTIVAADASTGIEIRLPRCPATAP